MEASYPKFGYTFHRARMDDWLYERATDAGADLRVGTGVKDLETDLRASGPKGPTHTLTLSNGDELEAQYVVLADGPQRRITLDALDQFTAPGRSVSDHLSPPDANHIAYQEYREFPRTVRGVRGPTQILVGVHARRDRLPVGVPERRHGRPRRPDDAHRDGPRRRGESRLLQAPATGRRPDPIWCRVHQPPPRTGVRGDEYDIEEDIPRVEDRGKSKGTETYPISSTRPIESPVGANIAVAGGAMGTTSAFHEGGYHVAVRTGKIAGRLVATDSIANYNDIWKRAIGDEILRNVAFADIVADYGPDDWDWAFDTVNDMQGNGSDNALINKRYTAGIDAAKILTAYKRQKFKYRDGRYVQLSEADYFY